jgi:acetolactate synthase I/II/III large subunit
MGAAIGAAVAAPDHPTVFVTGDGGFMMNGLAELHSCVRQDIPLVVVICNDGSYGAEYDQYVNRQVRADLSLFRWPSFADVAQGLGAVGRTITKNDDIPSALEALKLSGRTIVIDIKVDADSVPEVAH